MDKITAQELWEIIFQELAFVIVNMAMEQYGPITQETGLEIAGALGTAMDKAQRLIKED